MPHLTIEYSANVEPSMRLAALIEAIHETACAIDAFPMPGMRTRGERRDDYRIADGHPDNGFVHVVLRIAHGRSLDVRKAAGDQLFAVLEKHFQPLMESMPLALSFEIQEIDPVLNYKAGNIRDHLAARAQT